MTTRRELLAGTIALGLSGPARLWPQARRKRKRQPPPLPRVNGGINVQPVRRFDSVSDFSPPLIIPQLVELQLRAVYELGFRALRVTLSFNEFGPDFFGAIPYVRGARALGIDVIGIIDQFGHGFDLLRALGNPDRRRRVLEAYHAIFASPVDPASRHATAAGSIAFQVLNEPAQSRALRPVDYVRHFLAPIYADLKAIDPSIRVISAASVGRRSGLLRLREMLTAGLEGACDTVGLHIYDAALIEKHRGLVALPVEVTESGSFGTESHLPWVLDVFPRISEAITPLEEIHFFDLFDFEPGAFRLIEIQEDPPGQFRATIASPQLVEYLRERVSKATGGRPHATFDQLVPTIERYFPTQEDFAIVEQAR